MKRLSDYSVMELSALTDEQIDNLIDLECAFAGAPLPMDKPTEPQKPNAEPDVTLYNVCGYSFVNQTDAQKVAEAVSGMERLSSDWDYGIGSEFRHVTREQDNELAVTVQRVFSMESYNSIKVELAKYKTAKAIYTDRLEEYRKIEKARESVVGEVWKHIEEARRSVFERERNRAKYQRYLTLAEGNEEIATGFFCDALGISRETALEIINSDD